jgi:Domain of unknown function (DUF5668)
MADTERRAVVTPHLVLGVAALLAGILLLAGNLGFTAATSLLRYWPAALVVIGIAKLVRAGSVGGAVAGSAWLGVGAWLLANNMGVMRVTVWDAARTYWPLLLVVLGLSIVRQTLRRGGETGPRLDLRNELHVLAILGGNKGSSGSHAFRGGELTAILGGVNLDLREARMRDGRAVLDVFTMWGGLELRVPEGWIIENQMVVALGGYEDRTRPVGSPDAPRLVLRGTTVMGGVEIRN